MVSKIQPFENAKIYKEMYGHPDAVRDGKVQNLVHAPGPSKYGSGPWTPFMDRVHGPPIFTTPKITEVNNNKIKNKTK